MKWFPIRLAGVIFCTALCLTQSVRATVLYWDPTGATASATPTGAWDSTSANWSAANTLTASPVAWTPGVAACFCAGSSATGTFTVTLDETISCAGIFNGGLTPPGCFVTIAGAGALDLASGQDAFNSAGGNGGTTTIAVPLTGIGTVTLEGSKNTYFTATNTYSGGTQLGYSANAFTGTIFFNNNSSFGTGSIQMVSSSNMMSLQGTAPVTLSNSVTTASLTLGITANPAGLTFANPWTLGATTPMISCAGSGNLVTIAGVIGGSGGIAKFGAGALRYLAANTYTGPTTVSNGTFIVGATGSFNSSSRLNIYPGANGSIFDVSSNTLYTLGSSTTLFAAGTGTATTTAAMIRGSSIGGISFGSRPVILNFTPTAFAGDTTHPPLYITQGALTLNNNAFTVTNAAATALGAGTYRLIQVTAATINGSPNANVTVAGTGVAANTKATLAIAGGQLNLVVKPIPAYTNFSVTQTTAVGVGVQTVTVGGQLAAGSVYPALNETVTINLNGAVQAGKVIDSTGHFAATFNLSSIPYLPTNYPVTYSYAGNTALAGVTNSSTKVSANSFFQSDALAGFFGGENILTTNTAGVNMYAWSSTNPCLPVAAWNLEAQMAEQPLNDGSGKSRFTISENPTLPIVYYILGPNLTWPYASPTAVAWITTDGGGNQTFYTTNVTISAAGILSMPAPPVILQQTGDQTVLVGKNVNINVIPTGTPTLTYQWLLNGATPLSATTSTLTLPNVTIGQSGSYSVIVSNQYGTATSTPAALTVLAPPQMIVQPASNGAVELTATVAPSEAYVVQTTTDLTAPINWVNITTNLATTNGVIDFVDSNPAPTNLFYRLQFP
ncbi:MAG: immunoglobulin domain-containing protein [Limisphaerales bacterium]